MEDIFAAILSFMLPIWPLFYSYKKKIAHKFLFLSSVYGSLIIISCLLAMAVMPVSLFMIKIVPQFAVNEQLLFIEPLIALYQFCESWIFLIPFLLNIAMPVCLYRRYQHFW